MRFFILAVIFFQSLAYASNITIISNKEKAFQVCNNQTQDTIWKKLTSFSKFKQIDDETTRAAFLKANLVTSDVIWSKQNPDNSITAIIQFVIRPLSTERSPVSYEHQPKFVAKCTAKQSPTMSLTCDHYTKNVARENQFAVSDFSLRINFTNTVLPACKLMQEATYSISIDNDEYEKIKKDIFRYEALSSFFSSLTDVNTFFNDYWTAFFEAWKDTHWENK